MKRIVTIGGGSGQPALLRALSAYADIELSAIVTTMDSGGSSGILREEYDIVPPGDIRRCITALSPMANVDEWWNARTVDGFLDNHPIGNIVLTQLALRFGSMQRAIQEMERLFQVRGHVYPVSEEAGVLCAELADGTVLRGEHVIDIPQGARAVIHRVFLERSLAYNSAIVDPIMRADLIVLSFGDVWTSMIPNLLVTDVNMLLAESSARIVVVCNRTTKKGETDGWSYRTLVDRVSSYLAPAHLSAVVCDTQVFPVPYGHEAFIPEMNIPDIEILSGDFGDRAYPEKISAASVAEVLVSYAHIR